MRCKLCGHRANSLKAMGAHYRKKHSAYLSTRKRTKAIDKKLARYPLGRPQVKERSDAGLRELGFKFHPLYGYAL